MQELKTYLEAVGMRKPTERTRGGITVNSAVVLQLEQDDIPRLMEIARIAGEFFENLHQAIEPEEQLTGVHAEEWLRFARAAKLRIEELAASGSKAKWGRNDGTNGGREPRS